MNAGKLFINSLRNRLHGEVKQNIKALTYGKTGAGKSYSSIGLAYAIDPEFTIENNVVFELKDFVKKLKNKEFKKGNCIVYEEAGTSLDSREWQSLANKYMVWIVQTFRPQRLGLIFTLPQIAWIDKRIRTGVHYNFKPFKIDHVNETNHVRPYIIDYNEELDKIYKKYPTIIDDTGVRRRIKELIIPKAPANMIKEYEKIREEFADNLINDIEKELTIIDTPKQSKEEAAAEKNKHIIDTIMENPKKYMRPTSKGLEVSVAEIMLGFGIGKNKASVFKTKVQNDIDNPLLDA